MSPFDTDRPAPMPEADFDFQGQDAAGWRISDAYLSEGLSEIYHCRLTLTSRVTPDRPAAMLGQPCVFVVHREGFERRICGIVQTVEDLGGDGVQYHLRLTVVPALWQLSQRSNYRVFQNVDAIEVVRQVLKDADLYQGEGARREQLVAGAYATREYCVQYGETDLDFVMRLLAEEGVAFYFTHEGDTETLVLVDGGNTNAWRELPTIDGAQVVRMGHGPTAAVETISQFHPYHEMRPTHVVLRDYNFTVPRATQDMTRSHPRGTGPRTLYEYPGHYTLGDYDAGGTRTYRRHDGARRAQVRHEAIAAGETVFYGLSNVTGLQPGMTFTLAGHENAALDTRYLVVSVEHHAHAPDATVGGSCGAGDRYANNFTAIPQALPYRPPHRRRPRALGPQTATVMARPGSNDEICVDPHGRILVQFHWDRPELRSAQQKAMQSSCWVRVAQAWAGAQYGVMFIPRVGMEVVVSFIDGDPDRPLVTGCVYNGEHMPPHALPDAATQSVIKTSSSPGGQGYNELTFDDTAGRERIFMRAQHDHEVLVRHDQRESIGRDQSVHVSRDRTLTVDHNEVVVVKGDQRVAVHHHAFVQANDSLTLKVGNSKIELFPDRIVLSSPTIEVRGSKNVDIQGGVVDINK